MEEDNGKITDSDKERREDAFVSFLLAPNYY